MEYIVWPVLYSRESLQYISAIFMDENILQKFLEQEQKIDKIYVSVEKTRKYFFWTMILSLVFFLLPLLGLVFAIPTFLNTLNMYKDL